MRVTILAAALASFAVASSAASACQRIGSWPVYFVSGTTRVADRAETDLLLQQLRQAMVEEGVQRVQIVGFSDTVPGPAARRRLAARRADWVRRELLRRGLRAELLTVVDHGPATRPVPTEDGVRERLNNVASISFTAERILPCP